MKSIVFILMLLSSNLFSFSQTGISGKITNANTGSPLSGAVLALNHTSIQTISNNKGLFVLNNLTPGEYTLTAEYIGFATKTIQIKVSINEMGKVDITLDQKIEQLQTVSIFSKINQQEESGARQRERKATNIINVISAQAMERSPDINAANVLQRMSGVTIDRNGGGDEAYPIIRGLDPRYNNTLIDGIKITSPDDKSRYVPLNLVPSDLLGSIEVQKSLLPEMEGDAIGGTVNLVMKDAPEKETIKILGSIGYSGIFFDRKFTSFSKADIQQKSVIEKNGNTYTAQPGDFSRSNLDFKETTPMPNTVLAVAYGNRFFNKKLGMMVAGNYQNQYYGSNSIFNQAAPDIRSGQPTISNYATRNFSTQQMNSGVTLHLDYNFNEHNKLILTNTFLYSYLAQARTIIDTAILGGNGGRTVPGTGPIGTDYTSTTNQQLLENIKLEGKHILSSHFLFDWIGVFSYASKRAPDMADLYINKKIDTLHTLNDSKGPYTFISTPNYFDDISRIWQHNEDKDYDLITNLTYKSKLKNKYLFELKTGTLYRHKTRFNIQDEYILRPTTNSNGVKQEYININNAQWIVYNSSGTYDYDKNKYQLYENILSGYVQAKISLQNIELFGGVRIENTKQGYSLNTFYATGINGVDKTYTDILPSVVLNYKTNKKSNLRFSYYKGIARPNFYDLVPATRQSSTDATSTQGNPYLNHTVADNFDMRYEFFPKEEEQFFAGVFYKKIMNPIEYAYISGTTFKPQNFGDATDYGAELAFTKYFSDFGITGNYTYLYSKIYSNKTYYNIAANFINADTLQKRSLQGQSDHTLNISLLYRGKAQKFFAELSYQYIGKSIALVYPIYGYDYFREPQSNLAFSAEKQLRNKHFSIFGKFNNLLNTATKNQINNLLTASEITKFNFSLGLRYTN